MITSVCRGWHDADGKRIHYDVRVLIPGHPERGESDGFCGECKAIVFARLPEPTKKEPAR
jgi:hypothetical protein